MHIRRPQATDLSGMATLASKAMSDDPITAFVAPYRKPHPECMRLAFFRRAKKRLYSGKYLLIAITDQQDPDWDGTERVVGYLAATSPRWKAEQASQSYFSWNNLELAALSLETFFVDTVGADRSKSLKNQNAFLHELQAAYSTGPFARLEKYWDIDFLAVDPAYHRRGIGKALLGRVQALAAEESVPLTLLATAMGKHLYSHAGFVELCDLGSGSYFLFTAMIWHPEPSTEGDARNRGETVGSSHETSAPLA